MSTALSTERFSIDEFKQAYPALFKCEEILKTLADEHKVAGVQNFGSPISFFEFGQYRPVFNPETKRYGLEMTFYHGPNGLGDSKNFKPLFRVSIMNDELRYSYKRAFFDRESEFINVGSEESLVENLVGWIQSYDAIFKGEYERRGGIPDLDENEFLMRAVKSAMQKRKINKVQEQQSSNGDDASEAKRMDVHLERIDISVEDVEREAAQLDFAKVSDLRLWGRDVEHKITNAVKKIKSSFIRADMSAQNELQQAMDDTRKKMAMVAVPKKSGNGLSRLMFGWNKKADVKLVNPYEYLMETLEQLEVVSEAIHAEQQECLRLMSGAEGFTDPFSEYGDVLFLYKAHLDKAFKQIAASQTGLDGVVDQTQLQIRNNIKSRRAELTTSYEVWQGSDKGISNFLMCKNSQFENLETLKKKIDGDVMLMLQGAMARTMPTGSPKDSEAQLEIVREAIGTIQPVLDELQGVVNIGHEYDHALLNGTIDQMRPIGADEDVSIRLITMQPSQGNDKGGGPKPLPM